MKLWLDAQLSPSLVDWISNRFQIEVRAVRNLNLLTASDEDIFVAARTANAVVMSKDIDFVRLVEQRGTPPQLIWLTCGNTSNSNLRRILEITLENALKLLQDGDEIVEIGEA